MPTHAAFLRAVNLGRHRKTSKQDLAAAFEGAGFEDVHPFRTSGNVVFGAAQRASEATLNDAIEAALRERLGFEIPVFVRTAAQLHALIAEEPFPAARVAEGKVQVALLRQAPSEGKREEALAMASEDDLLSFSGARELLWLPRAGTQASVLNQRALEKLTGPWTMRTMGTLREIVAKYF